MTAIKKAELNMYPYFGQVQGGIMEFGLVLKSTLTAGITVIIIATIIVTITLMEIVTTDIPMRKKTTTPLVPEKIAGEPALEETAAEIVPMKVVEESRKSAFYFFTRSYLTIEISKRFFFPTLSRRKALSIRSCGEKT